MNEINTPLSVPDSLDSFINKMQISPNSKKKFFYMDYFNFCIRILTQNNLSQTFHIFMWIVISLLYDVAIACVCTPLKRIERQTSTPKTLFTNLIYHQVAFVMMCLLAGFTIYQVIYYFKFGSPTSISTLRANFLYFSFYFFPQMSSVICGFLFGKMFLEALQQSITAGTAFFYAISLFLLYFLLLLSRAVFMNIIAYHISPNGGVFSFYSPVVNTTDLLTFYVGSAFLPLRATTWYYYTVIGSVMFFIWGIVKLVFTIRNSFMTNIACFMVSRLYFDGIVFGAFGIITTWISLDQQLILEFWALMFFFDTICTFIFHRHWYRATMKALTPSNGHTYTEEQILRPLTALVYLRSGIAYQMPNAVSLDFMQFVLSHRFSEEALADIIRICISRNIPLSNIQYMHFVLKRKHTMRMRFLATQAILFKRCISGDDDPEVSETVARLSHEADSLETVTDNFWTDRDTKQLNIVSLAKEVRRVKKLFTASLMEFGKSEEIRDHWNQFAEVTLCAPHKATVGVPMLFTRVSSMNSPLAYGISSEEPEISKKKKKQQGMTIEKYVEKLTNRVTCPFKFIFFTSLLMFLIAIITINVIYYMKLMDSTANVSKYTNILQFSIALAHNILRESDKNTNLPTSQEIASIIGISNDEAKAFRQKISLNAPSVLNPYQYLTNLYSYQMPEPPEGCGNISVSLLAYFPQQLQGDPTQKRCYYMWTYKHIKYLDIYRESILNNFTPKKVGTRFSKIIYAFGTILGILFLLLIYMCVLIHRRWKSLLEIVRQITAVKTQRTETKEPDQALYATNIFLFMSCFFLGGVLSFYLYNNEFMDIDSISYELMKQDEAVSTIARDTMLMLSYVELSAVDEIYSENVSVANREAMRSIISKTQYVTTTNSSYVNDISPLDKWQTLSTASFSQLVYDLTQLLMDDHFIKGNYNFLMSRYIIMSNITGLVTMTLPKMFEVTNDVLEAESSDVWIWTVVVVLFLVAMTVLFKYILGRQKLWLYGVKYILRREMSVSQSRMKRIISMIEGYAESIFEKVPQPSYVVSKGDIIVMCNELAARLSSQTIPQMIGQKLSDYFGEFAPIKTLTINNCVMTFKFMKEPFGKDLDLIIVLDISKQVRYREKEQVIAELLKPKIENIPLQGKIIVITIRISCPIESYNEVIDVITKAEEKHKRIKRIAVSATYYKSVALLKDGTATSCVKFASKILKKCHDKLSIAIIGGIGTIVGVVENDTIEAVCSDASKRANQIVRDAPKGRCYIDYDIANTVDGNLDEYFNESVPILVSPLTRQ